MMSSDKTNCFCWTYLGYFEGLEKKTIRKVIESGFRTRHELLAMDCQWVSALKVMGGQKAILQKAIDYLVDQNGSTFVINTKLNQLKHEDSNVEVVVIEDSDSETEDIEETVPEMAVNQTIVPEMAVNQTIVSQVVANEETVAEAEATPEAMVAEVNGRMLCLICREGEPKRWYESIACYLCLAFFQRSIRKGSLYQCIREDGMCFGRGMGTKTCRFCRYNACIDAGFHKWMKKGSKYSNELFAPNAQKMKLN